MKKSDKIKTLFRRWLILLSAFAAVSLADSQIGPSSDRFQANEEENKDKTLSPYFFIQSDDPDTDQLPLKETRADVNIAGVIADVKITQVYKNEGKNVLEAIYVFPASTRAAVYEMKMTIGEREIIAIIQEKGKARQNYEQAKADGKSASLLEQMRPNVFQMNVANILPGDIITVEMHYTELLVPENSVYEFIYPTVVGPRYSNMPAENAASGEGWIANPYTREGEEPFYSFDISVGIAAGMPIQDVRCTSHNVNINYIDPGTAKIGLKQNEKSGGNRDFIVQYRLAGNKIQTGLLLYEGTDENFFLAMIQPPESVTRDIIPPREYVFIVDVSGSMFGFPLDISKSLLRNLIVNLKPNDRFNVLLFAGGSELLSDQSLAANKENINRALQFIDNQRGGGGTELLPALKKALALKGTEEYSRSFIIATDGYVAIEKEAFDLIRNNLGNANFFTFGIGTSVNRFLLEGMAHVGMGESFVITNQSEASPEATKFRKYIQNPVLTNIDMKFEGFETFDTEPITIPDVLAERPVIVYGKWKGKPNGKITLTGLSGKGQYQVSLDVGRSKPMQTNKGLKYLWARERIRILDDYNSIGRYSEEHAEQITALGLKYNLLTNYTSFIAIDSEIRNEGGNLTTVKQPLPLPEGVSNYAVGGNNYAIRGVAAAPLSGRKSKTGSGILKEQAAYDVEVFISDEEAIEVEKEEKLYTSVETMPEFPGNAEGLKKFIQQHLKYPESLKGSGIKGNVFVEFLVDIDGSVKEVKVIRGIHPLLDKEAIRLIRLTSKKWKPGKQNGKPVIVQMVIPVKFA
ncbi:MAG: TonB family protein [Bacteroidales bacterium]|nr:MAG: TonB family protein [Bacteroidales bacterium]